MSAKNLDTHNRWRNKTVAFRVSPEENKQIDAAVRLSGLTKQDYITKRLLCRDVVVQGNPRVYKALRNELAAVLEELGKDYVTGARARGIRSSVIIGKSVLRASMLTILTLLALSAGSLLGGTAIVETIFMWDGVGKMAVDAITMRDYPVIQAYVVWMAMIYLLINAAVEFLCQILVPRVRREKSAR